MLSEKDLTFKKVFDIAQSYESAAKNLSTLQETGNYQDVHQVRASSRPCYHCGHSGHRPDQCKFKTATCYYCGKTRHIRTVCQSRKATLHHPINRQSSWPLPRSSSNPSPQLLSEPSPRQPSNRSNLFRSSQAKHSADLKQINKVEPEHSNEEYTLFNVPTNRNMSLLTTVLINDIPLSMEIDTGAAFSVISKQTYTEHFSQCSLQSTKVNLKTYTGESFIVHGEFTAKIKYESQTLDLPLIVAGEDGPSLLGRNWLYSLCLNWMTIFQLYNRPMEDLLQKYSNVFTEKLGPLKGFKAKLLVDESKLAIYCKAHPVPYTIQAQVKDELNRLVQQKIIEPIPFSKWAAPIVPVLKADKKSIRTCGDFKQTINRVVNLECYPIPKIQDLFSQLSGGIVSQKLT